MLKDIIAKKKTNKIMRIIIKIVVSWQEKPRLSLDFELQVDLNMTEVSQECHMRGYERCDISVTNWFYGAGERTRTPNPQIRSPIPL